MESIPPEGRDPSLESEVEEGREDEGEDGGCQSSDQGQTKLKPRDAYCYTP